ncbi:MAG: putative cytokinetic ring protein SteA [Microthrixaceae bacterium]
MSVVTGTARVDRRTKDLVKRLQPGEIAVIDHRDLDRVAGENLAESGVAAVLNAAATSSGRYPNEGPVILLDAGIVLVDQLGPDLLDLIADGEQIEVVDDEVRRGEEVLATGVRHDADSIHEIHERSKANLGAEFVRFVENTAGYFESNQDLISDDLEVPDVGVDFRGRHVLMVVRGHDYRADLELLRQSGYISDQRPILIGVDGGADALIELGLTPDVVIGDFDSVSEPALRSGAKLVVHAFPDGHAPGAERLDEMHLPYLLFKASGTSEDIAMLLAFNRGAALIVAVGTHSSMVDFLDKGRSGMASTILTRMKVGPVLVDAKGVNRLYQSAVRKRDLAMLIAAALVTIVVIVLVSEPLRLVIHSIWADLRG